MKALFLHITLFGSLLLSACDILGVDEEEPTDPKDAKAITEGENPDWSPTGERLAYERTHKGERYIWLYSFVAGDAQPLTAGREPSWAPDGRRLTFERDKQIWILNTLTMEERQITTEGGTQPDWSITGRWIAFAGKDAPRVGPSGRREKGEVSLNLWLYDVETDTIGSIEISDFKKPEDSRALFAPEWIVGDDQLVFTEAERPHADYPHVVRVSREGGEAEYSWLRLPHTGKALLFGDTIHVSWSEINHLFLYVEYESSWFA